ncbi:MAG: hypothetical protein H6807_03905 [Planctomycetes bacterium]|nr:hypothetical protein [Planctomycetota bacterium]
MLALQCHGQIGPLSQNAIPAWDGSQLANTPLLFSWPGQVSLTPGAANAGIVLESTASAQYDQFLHFKDPGSNWFLGNKWTGGDVNGFGVGRDSAKNDLVIDGAGNVALGFGSPTSALHLWRDDANAILTIESTQHAQYDQAIRFIDIASNWFIGNSWAPDNIHGFGIGRTAEKRDLMIDDGGRIGIGMAPTSSRLSVDGDLMVKAGELLFPGAAPGTSASIGIAGSGAGDLHFDVAGSEYLRITASGNVGIGAVSPTAKLQVEGTTRTHVLQITGGADLAEPFPISGVGSIEAGMVVAINPEKPGELEISQKAYDPCVAGVLSGAGGVNPGIVLTQENAMPHGQPVALTGRVYCWCDASNGPIKPGDTLTTSALRGHAMKADDVQRAQSTGAVVGKAMGSLSEGRGLVLVLIK